MRKNIMLMLTLMLAMTTMARAQDGQALLCAPAGAFASDDNITVVFAPKTDKSGPCEKAMGITPLGGQISGEKNTARRLFVGEDNEGKYFFGYSVTVSPDEKQGFLQVQVSALNDQEIDKYTRALGTAVRLRQDYLNSAIAQLPQPILIKDGVSFTLNLMTNPATGVKLYDEIMATRNRPDVDRFWETLESSFVKDAPVRDFTVDNVIMKMENARLVVNGVEVSSRGSCFGENIWFYLPDHGLFYFGLQPLPGHPFEKIAQIVDNKITFRIGDNTYEWISRNPILGQNGRYNLWVLSKPDFEPRFNNFKNLPPEVRENIKRQLNLKSDDELKAHLKSTSKAYGSGPLEGLLKQ